MSSRHRRRLVPVGHCPPGWGGSLSGMVLVFSLATLLAVTTPIGTGEGVHEDVLLHPIFPHLHMIDGRLVSHADADAAASRTARAVRPTGGPVVGAVTGAEADGLGVALYPNLPMSLLAIPTLAVGQAATPDVLLPDEFIDAPPDPPPNYAQ